MNYAKIDKISVADGIGVRTVLYVSGCSLHCKDVIIQSAGITPLGNLLQKIQCRNFYLT